MQEGKCFGSKGIKDFLGFKETAVIFGFYNSNSVPLFSLVCFFSFISSNRTGFVLEEAAPECCECQRGLGSNEEPPQVERT